MMRKRVVVRLFVEDRNDERASEAVQVTKLQRETRRGRNKRATNKASTIACGFRASCPLARAGSSHLRAGKLLAKGANCDEKNREIAVPDPEKSAFQLVAFWTVISSPSFRLFHHCTHCFSTRFHGAITLCRHALSAISTIVHTRYPHDSQQLTPALPIARRNHCSYVALPAFDPVRKAPRNHRRNRIPDVHLIPCSPPSGLLEPAPRTSARECLEAGAWDGFWSIGDERYYARRTRDNGRQDWFRFADEEVAIRPSREPRVLPLRRNGLPIFSARHTMVVGTRGSRTMLVGSSRRERRKITRGASR